MPRTAAALILACALIAPAGAQERTEPVFGAFRPTMSATEAMAAAPELEWTIVRRSGTNAIIGAKASGALDYAGGVWNVSVGNVFSLPENMAYLHALDFERNIETQSSAACRAELSALLEVLEPIYGPFGQHPAFSGSRNRLYFAPYGAFRLGSAGNASRIRIVAGGGVDFDVYSTFNEIDEARGHAVDVAAEYIDEFHQCRLRFQDFMDNGRIGRARESRASPD